ncbi:hypothetical protein EVAR_86199_1 [Eumeta japonica]|uniref:G-protein coupled receptors family 1 profile domain-containing protein n=1 Tax=Eumeta variegata TaxID=151549 RepID=A0A4C1UD32_EUMVA|nr:hypothetical protein EVAR_86199_1 [Eumeta japonica]
MITEDEPGRAHPFGNILPAVPGSGYLALNSSDERISKYISVCDRASRSHERRPCPAGGRGLVGAARSTSTNAGIVGQESVVNPFPRFLLLSAHGADEFRKYPVPKVFKTPSGVHCPSFFHILGSKISPPGTRVVATATWRRTDLKQISTKDSLDLNDRTIDGFEIWLAIEINSLYHPAALITRRTKAPRVDARGFYDSFVINLLATNFFTTSLLAPAMFGEHGVWHSGGEAAWAGVTDAAAVGSSLAGLLAVLLIAADQHHAVTDPLRCHTRLLQRRPATLCAAAGAVATLVAGIRGALAAARLARPNAAALWVAEVTFATLFLCFGAMGPTATVCALYVRIYQAARSSGLRARAHGTSALQLHEPTPNLPELIEEGEGLTLRIDGPPVDTTDASVSNGSVQPSDRAKYGPYLLPPPEHPQRYPSLGSLRTARPPTRTESEAPRLPAVSSAPLLAAPLLSSARSSHSSASSRPVSIRCRISNASLFRYREESRAARVGLLTVTLVLLHVPHAIYALLQAVEWEGAARMRVSALALLVASAGLSPFLFALRSRRVQREARRLLLPQKSVWERANAAGAAAAATDGQRARAALELLRTLSPGGSGSGSASGDACRGSFSSGGSTQLSSASEE